MKEKQKITLGELKANRDLTQYGGKVLIGILKGEVEIYRNELELLNVGNDIMKEIDFETSFYIVDYHSNLQVISLSKNHELQYPFRIAFYDEELFFNIIKQVNIPSTARQISFGDREAIPIRYNEEYIKLFQRLLNLYQKAKDIKEKYRDFDIDFEDFKKLQNEYSDLSYVNLQKYIDSKDIDEIIAEVDESLKQKKLEKQKFLDDNKEALIGRACFTTLNSSSDPIESFSFVSRIEKGRLYIDDDYTFEFDSSQLRIYYDNFYVYPHNVVFYSQKYTDMMRGVMKEILAWRKEALEILSRNINIKIQ